MNEEGLAKIASLFLWKIEFGKKSLEVAVSLRERPKGLNSFSH
jgi:hypothetical protein